MKTDFEIAGLLIPAGSQKRIDIPVAKLPTDTMLSLPITVFNGKQPGPTLWLSAAIHGDELNGVEIIRQVLEQINPQELKGVLIAAPIVNVFGFLEQSRYLPDRRDLNRCFPGSMRGSLASRLANLFMKEIVERSTHGIDLHTASNHRTNVPQVRANLDDPATLECAKAFGTPLIIHSSIRDGSLRQAAVKQGIPILVYEAGEALRFSTPAIKAGVQGILQVMSHLRMLESHPGEAHIASKIVRETYWVRAARSGILRMDIELGQSVQSQETLGFIADAFGDKRYQVKARKAGVVIGLTQNPSVNQGDGIFHIAIDS